MTKLLPTLTLFCSGLAAAVIPAPQQVSLTHTDAPPPNVEGGYILRLSTSPQGEPQWYVSADNEAGRFYAAQTRRQLVREYGDALPQTLEVVDYPKMAWRGMHLDVSRHFFTVEEVKRLMDRMAELKLNRLHLHLTDGPGWRLEMKKYPCLTSVGAWRRERRDPAWYWPATRLGTHHDELYGGYYTQQDMRELIAYGRERHIMIVPEIDVPGHCYAAIFAYRELANPQFELEGNGLRGRDALNIRKPFTNQFVHDVFDEVMTLFPEGTPIHVGGDEVPESEITKVDQRLWMQGLVDHLRARGRDVIAWDETAMNGVKDQIIMVWHADQMKSLERYEQKLILCPTTHCYFDFAQRQSATEPLAMGSKITTLRDVFEMKLPEHEHVLGVQGNLWTEFIRGYDHLMYMAFPRGSALAERAWGSPRRSFEAFSANLKHHPHLTSPAFTRAQQEEFFRTDVSLQPADMAERVRRQREAEAEQTPPMD